MEITRGMSDLLTLLLFVLPLGLDTFVIAAAVGANWLLGWSQCIRLRRYQQAAKKENEVGFRQGHSL